MFTVLPPVRVPVLDLQLSPIRARLPPLEQPVHTFPVHLFRPTALPAPTKLDQGTAAITDVPPETFENESEEIYMHETELRGTPVIVTEIHPHGRPRRADSMTEPPATWWSTMCA